MINQNSLELLDLRLVRLTIERSDLLKKKNQVGLSKAESKRLNEIEVEIAAGQKADRRSQSSEETTRAALVSLTTSYQVERRRLGCP